MSDDESAKPIWVRRPVLVLVILVGIGAVAVATHWTTTPSPPEKTVAEQWMDAVALYGIEPVYPPEEDIFVGDVYAMISGDSEHDVKGDPLPVRWLRLWRMNLADDLQTEYTTSYQFPDTTEHPTADDAIWRQGRSQGSLYAAPAKVDRLPLAVLPDFTITAQKSVDVAAESAGSFAAAIGWNALGKQTTTFKLGGIETYGVSALAAENALKDFCKTVNWICGDMALRTQLSNILGEEIFKEVEDASTGVRHKRYKVELGIVSRVYSIRKMQTTVYRGNAIKGSVANKPASDNPGNGNKGAPPEVKASAAIASQIDSNTEVKPQTFERPIVFGVRTIRFWFNDNTDVKR